MTRFYTSAASIDLAAVRGLASIPTCRHSGSRSPGQTAVAETKLEVIRVLTDAEKTYWLLYAARRELEVRKKEYDLAVAQLDRAKRQVAAGMVAEVEITRAESGVADTVQSIITAQNTLRQNQRDLKRIVHRPDLPLEGATIVVPSTTPNATPYALDPDELTHKSMHERMELLETELQIATDTANIDAARNATLPLLAAQLLVRSERTWPRISGGVCGDARQAGPRTNTASLHTEIPIGNEAARGSATRRHGDAAANAGDQAAAGDANHRECLQRRRHDQRGLGQHLRPPKSTLILNARLLDVEIRSFNQGLRTSTEVLDAQTKLADAQSAEITAITAYQIAQVDLALRDRHGAPVSHASTGRRYAHRGINAKYRTYLPQMGHR